MPLSVRTRCIPFLTAPTPRRWRGPASRAWSSVPATSPAPTPATSGCRWTRSSRPVRSSTASRARGEKEEWATDCVHGLCARSPWPILLLVARCVNCAGYAGNAEPAAFGRAAGVGFQGTPAAVLADSMDAYCGRDVLRQGHHDGRPGSLGTGGMRTAQGPGEGRLPRDRLTGQTSGRSRDETVRLDPRCPDRAARRQWDRPRQFGQPQVQRLSAVVEHLRQAQQVPDARGRAPAEVLARLLQRPGALLQGPG